MTIRLQVRWPNPNSPMLGVPTVIVTADDAPIASVSEAPGNHQFDIPDGTATVQLDVEFKPTVPTRLGGQGAFVVLKADQSYVVDGTTLQVDPSPFRMANGELITQNVHPLIDTTSTGNAIAGVTIAEVRTEFVDATAMWRARADPALLAIFDAEREVEIAFVVIGATGTNPPMWFATFPVGLEPPTPEVGTLVFFRPTVSAYTQVFNAAPKETQERLNRYLLTPRDSRSPIFVNGVPQAPDPDSFFFHSNEFFARTSFQRALVLSGKPIVLLQPWPQGTVFGDAQTAKLPKLLNQILRFLRGMGHIAANQPTVSLGRLGLSGASAGGPGIFGALRGSLSLVRELYLFDPRFLSTAADVIIQWAARTPDFRLRMTGEIAFASMHAIEASVKQRVTGEAGDLFLTALPETKARWETVAKGGWPWWNFFIAFHPEDRQDSFAHHQFVIFGGVEFETLPDGTVARFTTFMEDFLKGSGF
jgi:hypothetical protein